MNRSTERVYGMKPKPDKMSNSSFDILTGSVDMSGHVWGDGKITVNVLPEEDYKNNSCSCENCDCKTTKKVALRYKYNEDNLIREISNYIDSTYSGHYVPGEDNDLQALDVWDVLGSMLTSCRDVALKYLWRIGRKGNKEEARKDILKTIHYCILMLYSFDKQFKKEGIK